MLQHAEELEARAGQLMQQATESDVTGSPPNHPGAQPGNPKKPFRPIAYSKDRKLRNRSPTTEEVGRYGAAVLTDIRRSRPGMIVALGGTAARLFGESRSIQTARKATLQFENYPLRVTFHPSYVRRFGGRNGAARHQAVGDLRQAWKEATISRLK